ncbi:MAG: glutamate--cysteine ligase [Thiotrichales bacterium]
MGQEISSSQFTEKDFIEFSSRLRDETALLKECVASGLCSEREHMIGYEVEAWLVDGNMSPAADNEGFLASLNDELACPELARFNIELNYPPLRLQRGALAQMHDDLKQFVDRAVTVAASRDEDVLLIGTLPTLAPEVLHLGNMTPLNRYRALNDQILRFRGRPVELDIVGRENLAYEHHDVMLEAATTSFQLHLQTPAAKAHRYLNASIAASFATVAVSVNSPYLFGRDLWDETRIRLFEQAIDVGGYRGAARGPLHRVSFGTSYVRDSILESFTENLEHFPVLLPRLTDEPPERFAHLRLHNGTIWRWNRPLVGFDENGQAHFRIEHRVMPSGPTVADMLANAAFFYGLVESWVQDCVDLPISFSVARDNFYQAARYGLNAKVRWENDESIAVSRLLKEWLLPRAREGLQALGVSEAEIEANLCIITERVASGRTGAAWQREFMQHHPDDWAGMTQRYLTLQHQGNPVHQWPGDHFHVS